MTGYTRTYVDGPFTITVTRKKKGRPPTATPVETWLKSTPRKRRGRPPKNPPAQPLQGAVDAAISEAVAYYQGRTKRRGRPRKKP